MTVLEIAGILIGGGRHMARRSSKAEGALLALVVIIGLPIWLVSQVVNTVGWVIPVVIVAGIIVFMAWMSHDKKVKRLAYLRGKYQDETTVDRILRGMFWEGQSAEQLLDSLGNPAAVDNKMLKTKTKEVWKYNHQGANRFGLRITVENGYVVGWDQKS